MGHSRSHLSERKTYTYLYSWSFWSLGWGRGWTPLSGSPWSEGETQYCSVQNRRGKARFLLSQAYGIVWKAADRRTGEIVAIKKIFDAFRNKTDAQEFDNHPNIIRLLNVIRAENDRDIYLVFESMDTDLHTVIRKGNLLKDIHKCYILYQLLRATKFIHSGNVIHRDQKPSNVLLDADCCVKLCDFGLARSLSQLHEEPGNPALTEYVATRWYRAPEILLSSHRYTQGVDMWSLGCILGEMLLGRPLFPGTSTLNQLELILAAIPAPNKEEFLTIGSDYSASVLYRMGPRQLLTLDSRLPPTTPPEALDLLQRLLVFDPEKRLTADEALRHPYVRRFHCPAKEPALEYEVILPIDDGVQLSVLEYRNRLYKVTSRSLCLCLFSVIYTSVHMCTRIQAHIHAHMHSPMCAYTLCMCALHYIYICANETHKHRLRSATSTPSLTAQAAAAVTNQALTRKDSSLMGVMTSTNTKLVPRLPPGPTQEARAPLRPARKMFQSSASQGTMGAAKASLGGYSQAYGTICRSALYDLPLSYSSLHPLPHVPPS
uniref:Mitogen-activated protein kinase 15 n=1 Tax=Vombatus ursinus TaxID=29139 RepID=A0A4X2MEP8_VOMUR